MTDKKKSSEPESPPVETSDESAGKEEESSPTTTTKEKVPIVSSTKRSRPPYKYDPNKITLRFLFANRDGLTVTVECTPTDTIGEVKGALLSVWPKDLPNCSGGDYVRLICMGKGILMPDTRTLQDCEVPVFKTHPTPINVSVRPENSVVSKKGGNDGGKRRLPVGGGSGGGGASGSNGNGNSTAQGCGCILM
eukprot:scaffold1525_cov142-Cylindrotheca_fusiformis.AAC.100